MPHAWPILSLVVAYAVLGPGALALSLYLLWVGRQRMGRLLRSRVALPADPPLVSVLVPARDEGPEIHGCIQRVLALDYPRLQVIAIDDRSTDATGAELDRLAAEHPDRLKVLHVEQLPPGWLGKCHALHLGQQQAGGEWLFFVDSDVRVEPDALRRSLALMIDREYDALSILTTVRCETFAERLLLPPLAGAWSMMFFVDQTNEDSEPDRAVANGQFFLIRASAYRAVGGHERVKHQIVEDVELMRALKKEGFKTRFFAGAPLAATRMHTTLRQMFHGWARIYAGTARGRVGPLVLAMAVICVSWLSAYVGLAAGLVGLAGGGAYGSGMSLVGGWGGETTVDAIKVGPATVGGARVGGAGVGAMEVGAMSGGEERGGGGATVWGLPLHAWVLILAALHLALITIILGLVYRWSGNGVRYALLFPLAGPVLLMVLAFSVRRAVGGQVEWRGARVGIRG